MSTAKPKIRLYVPQPFAEGRALTLSDNQAHYLSHVMRLKAGEMVAVFNGADGEWIAVSTLGGRAVGNLRQPNHLNSLLLWSLIALVMLLDAGRLRRALAARL